MTPRYVLALDQGTTSSRAVLFDSDLQAVAMAQQEFRQFYPQPGWVEHDADEIWASQVQTARAAVAQAGATWRDVAAIGVTNQRETTVVWNRATGRPVAPAIVWQDRRTAGRCDQLRAAGWSVPLRQKTGLVPDPYFSGTKLEWLLQHVPGLAAQARRGEVAFGTIDSWLLWNLSGGKLHVTDYSNAARTLLFNIHRLDWDDEILAELGVPRAMLPAVHPSSQCYGETDPALFGGPIPLAGAAGDQQAALFGQGCFVPGMAKNTYGTGCFLLMHTGQRAVPSTAGLLTTIAWGLDGQVEYALEGSVFMAGAVVQWLRDELGVIRSAAETEQLAQSVPDHGGVYLVPAFVGLGAPYWDPHARGTVVGLTRGTTRAHLARAALEAIAYQSRDVIDTMVQEAGLQLQTLRVDGGAAANRFLLQLQADILAKPVERPANLETTALGAACLAGLGVGLWVGRAEVSRRWQAMARFEPGMPEKRREELYSGWRRAVAHCRAWSTEQH